MGDFILLNIWLLFFLTLTALENSWKPKLFQIKQVGTKISAKSLLIFILCAVVLVLFFILRGPENWVALYIGLSLSLLIAAHAIWVSLERNIKFKILLLFITTILIGSRFLQPSPLKQNIFIIASLVWLGPFFNQTGLINQKRFAVISLVWLFYDIIFVWLTPIASQFNETTRTLGIPLALIAGDSFLGTGDLVWSGLLLNLLSSNKWRLTAIIILVGSNLLLGWYSYTTNSLTLFPLLVLWIPLGLILMKRAPRPKIERDRAG